jgi:hypothetical protein
MSDRLRVLVLESERGAADAAIGELHDAGHEVLRCHDPGAPAFPCRALSHDDCPVRRAPVDVALTVRSRPRSQPAPLEDGVRCALERHIPLVVAGTAVLDPYRDFATEVLGRTTDVVDACRRAASAPLARHGAVARDAVVTVLARHGATLEPEVEVHRRVGGLHVTVHGVDGLDHAVTAMASVRAIGALRALDHDARAIDVSFGS